MSYKCVQSIKLCLTSNSSSETKNVELPSADSFMETKPLTGLTSKVKAF